MVEGPIDQWTAEGIYEKLRAATEYEYGLLGCKYIRTSGLSEPIILDAMIARLSELSKTVLGKDDKTHIKKCCGELNRIFVEFDGIKARQEATGFFSYFFKASRVFSQCVGYDIISPQEYIQREILANLSAGSKKDD